MPCNCDHMEPTRRERELSKVACIADELDGKTINANYWQGYHPKVYSQGYDRYVGDINESQMRDYIVIRLRKIGAAHLSLEAQIWWRDYQRAHALQEDRDEEERQRQLKIQQAKAKLTAEDRELLGL